MNEVDAWHNREEEEEKRTERKERGEVREKEGARSLSDWKNTNLFI